MFDFDNMFGAQGEADKLNEFIKNTINTTDINIDSYSQAWDYLSKRKNTYSKGRKHDDLSSEELQLEANNAYFELLNGNQRLPGIVKVYEEINTELEPAVNGKIEEIRKKYNLNNASDPDQYGLAMKELNGFIETEHARLLGESKEFTNVKVGIEKALQGKYGRTIEDQKRTELENLMLPKWITQFDSDVIRGIYTTANIKLPKAWAEKRIMENGMLLKDFTSMRDDIWSQIDQGKESLGTKKPFGVLFSVKELQQNTLNPWAFNFKGFKSKNYKKGGFTNQEALKRLDEIIFGINKNLTQDFVVQQEYQEKLQNIRVPTVFGKDITDPDLTMDEWQNMLGDQVVQMVTSMGTLGYSTYAQEGGGAGMEMIEITAAMKNYAAIPTLENNFKDLKPGFSNYGNVDSGDFEKALEEFRKLKPEERRKKMEEVLNNGEIDLTPAMVVGLTNAGLDFASTVVSFIPVAGGPLTGGALKGLKFAPKSLMRNIIGFNLKGTLKAAKPLVIASGTEVITETAQEAVSISGVGYATGYYGNKSDNIKRFLEAGSQAFLTTGPIVGGSAVVKSTIKDVKANYQAKNDPNHTRNSINNLKNGINNAFKNGNITLDEKLEFLDELEAEEDIINKYTEYKDMTVEQKTKVIVANMNSKSIEEQIAKLEAENAKLPKTYNYATELVNTQKIKNDLKIEDLRKNLLSQQSDIITELRIVNDAKRAQIIEWINRNPNLVNGAKPQDLMTIAKAKAYFDKVLIKLQEEGNLKQIQDFLKGVDKLTTGKANAFQFGKDVYSIKEMRHKLIRSNEGFGTSNAFHHDVLHVIQENMSNKELAAMQKEIVKQLGQTKDPELQKIFETAKEAFEDRYGKIKKDSKDYYLEWMANLSDTFSEYSLLNLTDESGISFTKLANFFSNTFHTKTKVGMDWGNFGAENALEHIKEYTNFYGQRKSLRIPTPKGKVEVDKEKSGKKKLRFSVVASRSEAVDAVNEIEKGLKTRLKEKGKEYTKTEFQKSKEFNDLYESISLENGAINNYIKTLPESVDKKKKLMRLASDRLMNYNPEAKRKTDSKEEITIGEAIMSNIGFAKLDAAKELAIKQKEKKRTVSLDDPDVTNIPDTPIEKTTETDKKDAKLRKLKDFNVELDNGLADALTVTEVNNLLDEFNNGKITFKQAQKKMDELVAKDIRSALSVIIPKISKGKPTLEYDAFIRNEYGEVVQSLGINIIRKAYKPWFKQEKTGKKDYKNIDLETGKVSNFVKDTQINTTNKREYIRWFLESSGKNLTERRTALIRRIAKRKASLAVDTYVENNSDNLEATIKAKIRTMSDSAKNSTNEQVSFDFVRYSEIWEGKVNNINREMAKTKTAINGSTHYYKPPGWKKGDEVLTFRYKNGKWNEGFMYEQAFAETLQEISVNIKNFEVLLQILTEAGGFADAQVSYLNKIENHEIKKGLSAFFGSTLINNLNITSKVFTLANDIHNSIKSRDGKTTLPQFIKNTVIPNLKQKVEQINAEIDIYNKKYGYKKGDAEFAGQIIGNVVKGKKVKTEKVPREVWNKVRKELGVLKTGVEVIKNHYSSKGAGAVKSISIFGFGSFRLDPTSIFKGLEMLDAATEVYISLRYGKSSQQGSKEFVTFKPGIQFKIDRKITKGKPKNTENSGLTTEQGILDALGNPAAFSKNVSQAQTLDNAIKKVRSSVVSKGITVLDFDDTLATSKSLVRYTKPDGDKGTLTPEEYASTYQDLLGLGYVFDFSEFNKVVDGKVAPLFNKALKLQKKFGNNDMFVLTARPAKSAEAIFEFLKANGLNIPIKNITGLANSTAEAKALWMADKVGEGYNDFYFADDALQNVQAVDNMLNQFDVKRKIQQAKVRFSETMNDEFNKILENVTGIEAKKRFDFIKARKRGAGKGKFRYFVPPSHEDFVGLLYNFIGRGKEGNAHRDFFEQALVRPLNRANKEYDTARQSIANDYKSLNKQFKNVKNKLTKKTPDGDFTYQDAVRIYLWDKHGYKIPGLSPIDQKKLVELINSDSDLQAYAENINVISKQEKYVDPTDGWDSGDIRMDLDDATGRVGRSQFFKEFVENTDVIFSTENLNKIEAGYGKGVRQALEDMLYRIKTGRNKPTGQNKMVNALMNWVNGSVGSVMFFNMRSALLQQMSLVNYVNFADNNIFAAAKAFANRKQYWTDWAFIFNSDMLKQRRGGIQTDVNGAELAADMRKSKNPHRFLISKLLELGFLPTQIGDNIAIATGGATYYRNRINTYLKQGLSQKEAEAKAFTDFQDITQSTQQSARPDMVSQQQASIIGKVILNFQNVTSQFNRLGKKAFQDIYNRRITGPNKTQLQSDISNASRITYYFAVQNLIFYTLQTALFAMMFDDDEEDNNKLFLKKKERLINGSIDSVLRGSGILGSVIATLKNVAIAFARQRDVDYNPDESAVVVEALNFSPVLGIKARKIVNAEKTLNYNKKVIKEMETFDIDNPQWSAVTNYIEGFTNAPLNRIYNKTMNVRQGLSNEHAAWERVLLFLGWSQYNLDLENEKMDKIKESTKSKNQKKKVKSKYKTKTYKTKTYK